MKLNRNENRPKNKPENDGEISPEKKTSPVNPQIKALVQANFDKLWKANVAKKSIEDTADLAKEQAFEELKKQNNYLLKDQAIVKRHLDAVAKQLAEIQNKRKFNDSLHIPDRALNKNKNLLERKPELARKFATIIERTRGQFEKVVNEEFERSEENRYLPNESRINSIIPAIHPHIPFSHKAVEREKFSHPPEGWHPQKKLLWSTVVAKDAELSSFAQKMISQTHKTRCNLSRTFGHIVISMKAGETVSNDQATWMAQRHLTRMGVDIDQHAILMFRHDNTDKQHFHIIYNRVRHDGKVHHIFGASQICQLERDIQDKMFGIKPQINPGTALTKGMQSALGRLASGNLKAEIRAFREKSHFVDTIGEQAQMRLETLGRIVQEAGGGFVKHQYFSTERAAWLIEHCAG